MWLEEKSETMKLLPDNVTVLYFARDRVEPYVEIITVKDATRRRSLSSSEDKEAEDEPVRDTLPVLKHQSQLLDARHLERVRHTHAHTQTHTHTHTDTHTQTHTHTHCNIDFSLQLAAHMPVKTQGSPWQLAFSVAVHGSSLKTLYRNMAGLDRPVLLVIRDMHKKVFGAFSSDPFRVSRFCYGTGETFLFSFSPDFQAYRWSGENSYFMSGTLESLQIGGGGGGFGLWLNADLYRGSSFSCPTFNNKSLSTQEDFNVLDLEVWTVQNI
ncbi:nuclear receptor coactivator 7 isoform X1 [Pseudoliparis swirei]|uniref:nuclear receptor coactivator 7 isoform X1 n=1 Tax=Pseudoliparis swirei TaxID=2059687 RepID=UPI0024BE244A|nr:nuclear receptor coactivator 7 isoform X1 [Pseudoliparis swirei]XP_056299707.1 nuclear receptor coactivator 7 isoform X1 [Pseudoliparis swirei]XP_056299708.1 nuclear receptor coactivator 7 isoform X1 [Pseudoliparis swirei]